MALIPNGRDADNPHLSNIPEGRRVHPVPEYPAEVNSIVVIGAVDPACFRNINSGCIVYVDVAE